MASSALLRPWSRLLAPARLLRGPSRSKFYVREPLHAQPNWPKVVLSLAVSGLLWFKLLTRHEEDLLEYKKRNGLE
ncbi:NADH dehydrogenase [ubiquinone] 1 subunit C1, mitochondrial [Perognathus longimembris pacificus]|uniref:NADH dehydrogenase [ubiquinone] 1 subunit C1, mitochondrial n=1 Tax=Perognathus longimembris pacificus TaxID=214514 RepID=UPI0020198CDC|nr:NADH dehydrogenase [ubiquinone] 1 subunit C1, mitochondrial [Perognathus longimembris pacificus]